jgi:large subunit ribosomal protein L29
MEAEDLKTKTLDELNKLLLDERKNGFNLRFQKSAGTLENTAAMRKSRRTIARIKTFISQKRRENAGNKAA